MIQDPFSGDPKMILGPQGSSLQFTGGQPLMDQGMENPPLIVLFTAPGWVGNLVLPVGQRIPGSTFEAAASAPITSRSLNNVQDIATKALQGLGFPEVKAVVTNPQSYFTSAVLTFGPGQQPLALQKYGPNWQQQAQNPASAKVTVQL